MGFLKKAVGLVYEFDEKPDSPPAPSPRTVVRQVQVVGSSPPLVDNMYINEFKKKFEDILADENKRNYPGNDYFEFKAIKDAMEGLESSVRYQAAFAGWRVIGSQTKKSLVDSANVYLGLTDKEIADFEKAYNQQHEEKVGANEKLIEQKQKELTQMKEKMQKLNDEVVSLTHSNTVALAELLSKKEAFMAAGQAQRQEILEEIGNINNYIN